MKNPVTTLATRPPATLPDDQYQILRRFAAGRSVDDIARETGRESEHVLHVVQSVAKLSKPRAIDLVHQHETWMRNTALKAAPSPADIVPTRAPVPAQTSPALPTITVTRVDEVEPTIETIDDLLDAAEASGVASLVRSAELIRARVATLQTAVTDHAHRRQLLDEEAQLRERLAAVRAQLRGESTPPTRSTPAAPTGAPTPKAVRAWAAANGVTCNPNGRVPQSVVDQYLAAR